MLTTTGQDGRQQVQQISYSGTNALTGIRVNNQAVVAARSGISLRVSARVFVSENTVVALEIVENYKTKFSS